MVAEFLKNIMYIDMLIDTKIQQINDIRNRMCYVGISYGDKVQGSKDPDKFTNGVAKIIELEEVIDADIDKLVDMKSQAREMIETLERNVDKVILYKRYFERKGFDQIANELNYSKRRIEQLHSDAICTLEKRFGFFR